ncbi:hypothetical protein G9A89_005647 [Geosiphon pyriformis]|nr:hypothetical protein G9A89_005647 [Geosiphon pyriformis]
MDSGNQDSRTPDSKSNQPNHNHQQLITRESFALDISSNINLTANQNLNEEGKVFQADEVLTKKETFQIAAYEQEYFEDLCGKICAIAMSPNGREILIMIEGEYVVRRWSADANGNFMACELDPLAKLKLNQSEEQIEERGWSLLVSNATKQNHVNYVVSSYSLTKNQSSSFLDTAFLQEGRLHRLKSSQDQLKGPIELDFSTSKTSSKTYSVYNKEIHMLNGGGVLKSLNKDMEIMIMAPEGFAILNSERIPIGQKWYSYTREAFSNKRTNVPRHFPREMDIFLKSKDQRTKWKLLENSVHNNCLFFFTIDNSIQMYDLIGGELKWNLMISAEVASSIQNVKNTTLETFDQDVASQVPIFTISRNSKYFAASRGDDSVTVYAMSSKLEIITRKFQTDEGSLCKIEQIIFDSKDQKLVVFARSEPIVTNETMAYVKIIFWNLFDFDTLDYDEEFITEPLQKAPCVNGCYSPFFNTGKDIVYVESNGKTIIPFEEKFKLGKELSPHKNQNHIEEIEILKFYKKAKYLFYEPWDAHYETKMMTFVKWVQDSSTNLLVIGKSLIQIWELDPTQQVPIQLKHLCKTPHGFYFKNVSSVSLKQKKHESSIQLSVEVLTDTLQYIPKDLEIQKEAKKFRKDSRRHKGKSTPSELIEFQFSHSVRMITNLLEVLSFFANIGYIETSIQNKLPKKRQRSKVQNLEDILTPNCKNNFENLVTQTKGLLVKLATQEFPDYWRIIDLEKNALKELVDAGYYSVFDMLINAEDSDKKNLRLHIPSLRHENHLLWAMDHHSSIVKSLITYYTKNSLLDKNWLLILGQALSAIHKYDKGNFQFEERNGCRIPIEKANFDIPISAEKVIEIGRPIGCEEFPIALGGDVNIFDKRGIYPYNWNLLPDAEVEKIYKSDLKFLMFPFPELMIHCDVKHRLQDVIYGFLRGLIFLENPKRQRSSFMQLLVEDRSGSIFMNPMAQAIIDFKWEKNGSLFTISHIFLYLINAALFVFLAYLHLSLIVYNTKVPAYSSTLVILMIIVAYSLLAAKAKQVLKLLWTLKEINFIVVLYIFDMIGTILPLIGFIIMLYVRMKYFSKNGLYPEGGYCDNERESCQNQLIFFAFAVLAAFVAWIFVGVFGFFALQSLVIIGIALTMFILLHFAPGLGIVPGGGLFTGSLNIKNGTSDLTNLSFNNETLSPNLNLTQSLDPSSPVDNYFYAYSKSIQAVYFWISGRWDQLSNWDFWPVDVITVLASIFLVTLMQNLLIALMGLKIASAEVTHRATIEMRAQILMSFYEIRHEPRRIYYAMPEKIWDEWWVSFQRPFSDQLPEDSQIPNVAQELVLLREIVTGLELKMQQMEENSAKDLRQLLELAKEHWGIRNQSE